MSHPSEGNQGRSGADELRCQDCSSLSSTRPEVLQVLSKLLFLCTLMCAPPVLACLRLRVCHLSALKSAACTEDRENFIPSSTCQHKFWFSLFFWVFFFHLNTLLEVPSKKNVKQSWICSDGRRYRHQESKPVAILVATPPPAPLPGQVIINSGSGSTSPFPLPALPCTLGEHLWKV